LPKKKSLGLSLQRYRKELDAVVVLVDGAADGSANRNAIHEWSAIRAFASLEGLMMDVFMTALNRTPEHFTSAVGVPFPKHLSLATCRYLIVGDGYFGFRDRDDLKDQCKKFLGTNHTFVDTLSGERPAVTLEVLVTARNYAAHQSTWAKEKLRKTLRKRGLQGADKLGSPGSYLAAIDNSAKWRNSFEVPNGNSRTRGIVKYLRKLGDDVENEVKF
jgi:hypothetical protein